MLFTTLAPETWRRLMHDSFRFANWARSTELALFSSVPQIAIRYGISLIFGVRILHYMLVILVPWVVMVTMEITYETQIL